MPQGSKVRDNVLGKTYIAGEYLGKGQLGIVYGLLEEDGKTPVSHLVVKEPLGRLTKADRARFDRELEVLEKIKQAANRRNFPNPVPDAYKGERQDPITGQVETVVLLERAQAEQWRLQQLANDQSFTRDNETLMQAAIQYTLLLELLHETDEVGYFCRDRTALDLLWHPKQNRLMVLDWNVVEPISPQNKAEAWADGQQRFGALWYELLVGERFVMGADPDKPLSQEGIARWSNVSDGMRGILINCLAVNPRRRYPNVRQLRQALNHQATLLNAQGTSLMTTGEALEKETQQPPENQKPEYKELEAWELERRALAAFDLASRRGMSEAQSALNRMREFVSGRSLRYLKEGREAASRGNWDKALQALGKALEEAGARPQAILPIHRWRLAVQAGQSALASFTTSRSSSITLLKDQTFKSLDEALDAMSRDEWDKGRDPLARVCTAMQWDPGATSYLENLRRELDLRQAIKQAYTAQTQGSYAQTVELFEKAERLLTQITDQAYAEAIGQALPPLLEEIQKARALANQASDMQHYLKVALSLTHETDFDNARATYEAAMEALNRSSLASPARYEALRAKYAPALETLDAVDLLRTKDYVPAFEIARQALDKHTVQYPYVAEYLAQELRSSLAQISANGAKSTTAITTARHYLQAIHTAFQSFVYPGPQPPPPAFVSFIDELQNLAQGQPGWSTIEREIEMDRKEFMEAVDSKAPGKAVAPLEHAREKGIEIFSHELRPELAVVSLLPVVKGMDALRKLAEAAQEDVKRISALHQTAQSQAAAFKEYRDQAWRVQTEIGSLFLMKDLAAAEAFLQSGDSTNAADHLKQAQNTLRHLQPKEDYPFSRRHAQLEEEWNRLEQLSAWDLLARCGARLGGTPPQPLTLEDAESLSKLCQQNPTLRTPSFWLEKNMLVALSTGISESLKPLDHLRAHLCQLLLNQELAQLQSAIDEPLLSPPTGVSPLVLLLTRYEKELWRGIVLDAKEMDRVITSSAEDWSRLDQLANCLRLHDAVFAVWHQAWKPRFKALFEAHFAAEGYWVRNDKGQKPEWRLATLEERNDQTKNRGWLSQLLKPKPSSAEIFNLVEPLLQPYLEASHQKSESGRNWLNSQVPTNHQQGPYVEQKLSPISV